ncbi:RNA-guided endonuclease TnpB family protein [Hymenobacter sp.]|jgi:putative transposase|uniref:RNA-guided endonuclease TnpB family protein n=1 Tax=Hymenobacter sp. TaxID=1898978 RepID=UPI002ED89AC1
MLRGYSYRLYPTLAQTDLLNQHIGSARFVYNLALDTKQQAYTRFGKTVSCFDLINQLPDLKTECPWLKLVNSQSLQMALRNLDNAFTNFFRGRGEYPTFRKKAKGGSFQVPANGQVDFRKGTISLPKFKSGIKAVFYRKFRGTVKTVTIRRTPTGKFFASVLVDTNQQTEPLVPLNPDNVVGLDLGIKDFLVTSEGEAVANPRHLRNNLARLKVLQRRASHKVKGSANRRKANLQVAKQHERITNSRKDFLHQLSSRLVKNHDGIAIEDLAVKNLLKNHKLAQAISDVSWTEFRRQLEYKCDWQGKHLLVIGRFQPSTKLCSTCGYTNHTLTLADREWDCPSCDSHHDRDHNAAINIKQMALIKHSGAERSGEPVEMLTLVRSLKQEKFSALDGEAPIPLG